MDRLTQLEQAIAVQHNIIKKLVNETLTLRVFAQAVFAQPAIDLQRLRDDYVELWEQAVQQLPPETQDKAALQILLTELDHALTHRDAGRG